MKCLYVTIEIILSGALMYYGETVGTNNMWYVLIGIIISHFIMNLLYNIRNFEENNKTSNTKNKPKTKAKTNKNIKTTKTSLKPISEKESEITADDLFNIDSINTTDEQIERIFYNQDIN